MICKHYSFVGQDLFKLFEHSGGTANYNHNSALVFIITILKYSENKKNSIKTPPW